MIRIKGIAFYFAFIRLLSLHRLLTKRFMLSQPLKFPQPQVAILAE